MVKKRKYTSRKKTSQLERAYLAGFFDGEGTIGCNVSKTKKYGWTPYLRVAFSNYDVEVLKRIEYYYGGSLSEAKTQVWSLHLNGPEAFKICIDIQPYVVTKAKGVNAAVLMYRYYDNYLARVQYAVKVMEATHEGYKAERTSKNLDRLKSVLRENGINV